MKFNWQTSRRGNLWVKLPGAQGPTITVFFSRPKGVEVGGWRYCVARSAKEKPFFSDIFTSQKKAMRSVEAHFHKALTA